MTEQNPIAFSSLVSAITQQIEQARGQVRQAVNTAMVQSYWEIGRLIVEHEQQGSSRAEYGKQQLQQLSQQLTERLGKGFDITNLRNMRRFYRAFPNRETVSLELSWSHYNLLAKVENSSARAWYQQEAEQHSWSVRALARQINTLYYERLLASQDKLRLNRKQKKTPSRWRKPLKTTCVIPTFWTSLTCRIKPIRKAS